MVVCTPSQLTGVVNAFHLSVATLILDREHLYLLSHPTISRLTNLRSDLNVFLIKLTCFRNYYTKFLGFLEISLKIYRSIR